MSGGTKDSNTRIISNDFYFAEVQRMLDEGKEVRIRIKGGSMRPFISDGDTVLLRAYKGEVLTKGCNVLALHEGKYVFHRYVAASGGKLILAGDGNLVLREYIGKGDIIAVALSHTPQNSGREIDLNSGWARLRGLSWYHLRLPRRIIAKMGRMLSNRNAPDEKK